MGLAQALGWNAAHDFIDPRRNMLIGLGAGLLQGRPGSGVMEGRMADDAYATQQKAETERLKNINMTAEWVAKNAPQYAGLPPEQAWQAAMLDMKAKQDAANNSTNMGLTPIWGVDAQGNPVLGQMSGAGGIKTVDMPEGVTFGKEPIRLDAGDKFVLLDPVTRQQIGVIPKNGDVPTGFQQNPQGGISPMPGGEQDIERQSNLLKMGQRATAADDKAKVVIDAIDQATDQSTWATTGFLGNVGRGVGLTPHRDLQGTIDTIRANLGFNELQAMREASPTGGALGQVAIQELEMLQSTIASLDPSQSEEQLDKNLKIIKELLERQKMYRQAALEEQQTILGGGQTAAPGNVTSTGVPWSFEP